VGRAFRPDQAVAGAGIDDNSTVGGCAYGPRGTEEVGVSEREDPTVGGNEPVTPSVGGGPRSRRRRDGRPLG
jgi:hypothetical protein